MNTSVRKQSFVQNPVVSSTGLASDGQLNEDPFPKTQIGVEDLAKNLFLIHEKDPKAVAVNDESYLKPEQQPQEEFKPSTATQLEKIMEIITGVAVGTNAVSIGAKLREEKGGLAKTLSKPLEKLALLSTKAQAVGFATKILQQAFEEKDVMLLLAGLGKVVQTAVAGVDNFLVLGGFQTAFDQLNPGLKKTVGLEKFNGFSHSISEYAKALKIVFKDMKDDPLGYLNLAPKNGHVERVLVPGAISILFGTLVGIAAGGNRLMRMVSGFFRHILGGIIGGDVILAKLSDNKDMNISGSLYMASSGLDGGAPVFKDPKKEDIAHQTATLFNFVAELFFLKGLKKQSSELQVSA